MAIGKYNPRASVTYHGTQLEEPVHLSEASGILVATELSFYVIYRITPVVGHTPSVDIQTSTTLTEQGFDRVAVQALNGTNLHLRLKPHAIECLCPRTGYLNSLG
jgi:hypothetical protein